MNKSSPDNEKEFTFHNETFPFIYRFILERQRRYFVLLVIYSKI